MGGTLCYAADLLPEIADDIVNVDRAMRWGFNWANGPFELLDAIGPERVIARLEHERAPLPTMLQVLRARGPDASIGTTAAPVWASMAPSIREPVDRTRELSALCITPRSARTGRRRPGRGR